MMSFEAISELLLVDAFWLLVCFNISVPPIYNGSNQLMCFKQNPLSVGALNHLWFLFNGFKPVIDIHWLNKV
jgi:hypothetical protein